MIVSEGQTETVSSSEQSPMESTETKEKEENQDQQGTANTSHTMFHWKCELRQ